MLETASARSNGPVSCRIRLLGGANQVTQALPKQALRPVQPRHHGAERDVEGFGDLVIAELAKGMQRDGVTIVWRLTPDRVTNGPLQLMASCDVLWIGAGADEWLLKPVERDHWPAPPERIGHRIRRHPVQPVLEGVVIAVGRPRLVEPDENRPGPGCGQR